LAGPLYPAGIPILPEGQLEALIHRHAVQQVILAYSDLSHVQVMHIASRVLAAGADFQLLGPTRTMLPARVPVVSVCAVRTGSGKSQTTRRVADLLRAAGHRVAVVRHPMPYGDLTRQAVQRFATPADLDRHACTIEEREEYEPLLERGLVVYAGVDYGAILARAEAETDVILWDGGNNDFSFYRPDVQIAVVDPHRPGHEISYYPGETVLRMADAAVINKIDSARPEDVETVRRNVAAANPRARVVLAASPITVENSEAIRGRRVLVVEDGPTLTHGGMSYGAGFLAAQRYGAAEIVDPRPHAVGSLAETFRRYPHTGPVLPAMGYGPRQIEETAATIAATPCDMVLVATPVNLARVMDIARPSLRVRYELEEIGRPHLGDVLAPLLAARPSA
jgi:predicted GTPase